MVESLSPSILLVAGCGTFSEEDCDEQPSRRESLSVLVSHPGLGSLPEADKLILHITYLKRPPYPPLQLSRCLVSCGEGGCALPLSVVLNTGDTIRVLTVVSKAAPRSHEPFGNEHDLETRLERVLAGGEEEGVDGLETVQGCFDAEEYLSQLLTALNRSGQLPVGSYHVADYDLELVEASADTPHPHASAGAAPPARQRNGAASLCRPRKGGGGCAAVGLVAVLQGEPGSAARHVMVGHLLLLDLGAGAVLHRISTRIQPCHPLVLAPPSPLAARFAASWQAALHHVPLHAHRQRNLLALDNDSVHLGKSLPILPNPRYPVDITPPS
jgi:hypothetical protein